MKKSLIGIFVLVGSVGMASLAYGAISTSLHNFSGETWVTDSQICLPCHAPHGGTVIADAPLWNHVESGASYTLYTNAATLDAVTSAPTGVSKLCLSCHDGTVAVDAFTGHTGVVFIDAFGTGTGNIGTDLSNDHPISFTYDSVLAATDGGLHDPALTSSAVSTGTIDEDMLFNGKMECASCHDVHNKYGINKLLVKSNAGSALCLTCHDK